MMTELLRAYQRHTKTLIDILNEAKELASQDYDAESLLCTVRDGLRYIVSEIQPSNVLSIAMIQDTSSIECNIDQSEFLTNVAAAVLNVINAEIDSVQTQQAE
ncbi:MAG: hypothetical protein HC836_42210 [Richelia sp. RM2_1_2]|nr:hypothetical protein [Richelia sp. SM2_1_7]NJM24092.1 hypothetical protein [Richelia sp. SM1_7_0]NJN13307.1 hypothetical protein [Richelia sp. RM1_1_1]NJO30544.1 hypothetical protein [Richelia sp. SL_2_1]NJO64527.1 hypothetical protein [Richelia sp. RM2_1_2]NJS16708.1 hypothetical protein [Nostocaceae cyanobacterium CSU_2_110]